MGSGMPEIGSRISLISKADIRYEGKLFAVDPEECTIALSSVRSYGTEDRPTTYPVPPQHQVYDFILFRGSDIKDIRVLTAAPATSIPNDPAIVQLSAPAATPIYVNHQQRDPADGKFQASGGGSSASVVTLAPDLSARPTQTCQNDGAALGNVDQVAAAVTAAAGEHSTPPPPPLSSPSVQNVDDSSADASPAIDDGAHLTGCVEKLQSPQPLQQRRQPTYVYNRDANGRQQPPRYQQQSNSRYQPDGGDGRQQYLERYQQNRYSSQQHQHQQRYQQQSQYRDYNNRDGNQSYRNYYNNNDFGDVGRGQRQYSQPPRGNVQRGGGGGENWNSSNNNYEYGFGQRRTNRVGHYGAGVNQQPYQAAIGGVNGGQNRKPRLKFEDDYDFEQANSQFEEMRSQLAQTKIAEGPDEATAEGSEKKAEVGGGGGGGSSVGDSSVGGGEEKSAEPEPEGDAKAQCYDKVKSFFDQISYEAIERSKGLTRRIDWKTEKKVNSDTFGQVALRNGGGGYRGRANGGGVFNGYYQNNNRNGGGGVQNNYRTGGGFGHHRFQSNQRWRYNNASRSNAEESKENPIVVA